MVLLGACRLFGFGIVGLEPGLDGLGFQNIRRTWFGFIRFYIVGRGMDLGFAEILFDVRSFTWTLQSSQDQHDEMSAMLSRFSSNWQEADRDAIMKYASMAEAAGYGGTGSLGSPPLASGLGHQNFTALFDTVEASFPWASMVVLCERQLTRQLTKLRVTLGQDIQELTEQCAFLALRQSWLGPREFGLLYKGSPLDIHGLIWAIITAIDPTYQPTYNYQ